MGTGTRAGGLRLPLSTPWEVLLDTPQRVFQDGVFAGRKTARTAASGGGGQSSRRAQQVTARRPQGTHTKSWTCPSDSLCSHVCATPVRSEEQEAAQVGLQGALKCGNISVQGGRGAVPFHVSTPEDQHPCKREAAGGRAEITVVSHLF